ncbi:MAG: transcriptional regulator [Desulfurococcales archaeon]|nr:transcriptional regulator [Desulfurococcales archaeon]
MSVDDVLARPKRLAITALLYLRGPATMAELRRALGLSWGDLDSNLRALREAGYVEVRRIPTLRGPRTVVSLTQLGRKRFEDTVEALERLVAEVKRARGAGEGPRDPRGNVEARVLVKPSLGSPTSFLAIKSLKS